MKHLVLGICYLELERAFVYFVGFLFLQNIRIFHLLSIAILFICCSSAGLSRGGYRDRIRLCERCDCYAFRVGALAAVLAMLRILAAMIVTTDYYRPTSCFYGIQGKKKACASKAISVSSDHGCLLLGS